MVCGDFNARCGNLQEECFEDSFPSRIVLDTTCNKNGRAFIDFLNSLDLCMLNGRFDTQHDGFTSVSAKGLAVVDYCVVPKVSFHKYCDFKVLDPLVVATNSSIKIDSKIPDHRILTWGLKVTDSVSPIQHITPKKTIVQKKVPPNFLENDVAESRFHALTEQLKCIKGGYSTPFQLDEVYKDFCSILDRHLQHKNISASRNRNKAKPWWDQALSNLGKSVAKSLRVWEMNKADSTLKQIYVEKQKAFSKAVRKAKRVFKRRRQVDFLHDQKFQSKRFWTRFKKLTNQHKRMDMPDSVISPDGVETNDPERLKKIWEEYFRNLLNIDSSCNDDIDITPLETALHLDQTELNEPFSREEVEAAIQANINKKAPGHDEIGS